MKFYKRFPGDIQSKTGHLSLAEFGAFDRLLDHYYSTEAPLPKERARCYAIARAISAQDRRAVDAVLSEFFHEVPDGFVQQRAAEMIAEAQPKIAAAKANGFKGGRPKKAKTETQEKPSGFTSENQNTQKNETQSDVLEKASQSQSSSLRSEHSEPDGSGGRPPSGPEFVAPRDVVFGLGVPILTAAGVKEPSARSFLAMRSKTHGDIALAAALEACAADRPIQPIPWLEQRLGAGKKVTSKHAGFAQKNYLEGIESDGSIA